MSDDLQIATNSAELCGMIVASQIEWRCGSFVAGDIVMRANEAAEVKYCLCERHVCTARRTNAATFMVVELEYVGSGAQSNLAWA